MLKALELVGFKSFADRTRFEFPPGITAVVGPNGSGKSNIVDAIKWVLGEQRVKSLRGTEMADVIFNGSGSRRPMNSAEITLTLDNSNRLLPIDTPEVHITRRLYRSGESEYLINRQPCRLRDIRDLLSGTGMGTQAYSVIEQGKMDVLLQASARDRRVILEEAAGISRFKAKRLEAERRLERVEQNLLRLSDIVEEVESRLRSVRLQANKARRYKQYTDRLQELRTQVGLVDWRRLTERLAGCEAQLASLKDERNAVWAQVEAGEARLLEMETRLAEIHEAIRRSEVQQAANRERIAAAESSIEHQRAHLADLEGEVARYRLQLAGLTVRAGDLEEQLRQTAEAVHAATQRHRQIARLVAESERAVTDLIQRLDQLRSEMQQRRVAYMDRMRVAADLASRVSGLETRLAAAAQNQTRIQSRIAQLDEQLQRAAAEKEQLEVRRQQLAAQLDGLEQEAAQAEAQVERLRQEASDRQRDLAELESRAARINERMAVLEELESRREGIGPGAQDVLALAKASGSGPLRAICGLVADVIHASVEAASLVEVALGEKAQYVVARRSPELLDYLARQSTRLAGQVTFIWLDSPPAAGDAYPADLEGEPGVVGRADRFVTAEPECRPLVARLLGHVWIVESLDCALRLAASSGQRLTFVTLAGQRVGPDGTLTVGPPHGTAGLISRRSELHALREQLEQIHTQAETVRAELSDLEAGIARRRQHWQQLVQQQRKASDALHEHHQRMAAADAEHDQLRRQRTVLEAELRTAASEHQTTARALAEARQQHASVLSSLAEMERQLQQQGQQIEQWEADRQGRQRQITEAKVELAKSEERLENLRSRMRQFAESQQERLRAITETQHRLEECQQRAAEGRRTILRAESEIAELYLRKEALARETVARTEQREALAAERTEIGRQVTEARSLLRQLDEQIHAVELSAGQVRHERTALADRLREDYGIELGELGHEPSDEEQHQREAVQQEIDELRRKINNIGNVNLEALEELEQLEARHQLLASQYQDLAKAKASLVRIIEKINADSRRLFSETLETVRGHFRTLFRDLFGGGQADIVLEEGVDILESGIEIVARPPGKEPRSISLLSGGEKTLTCVALLLAIFRSRPSPFCVLDEVDAALDEANIDRFTNVLKGFLTWTQFIIVTHSKKTMTCANTIYGVTMQESGVSKQVSVRFEDVSDTGEILLPPETPLAEDEHQAA